MFSGLTKKNSNRYHESMKRHFLPILFIVTVSIAIYSNTLQNEFVYDDEDTIVNNTLITSFNNLSSLFEKNIYFSRSGEGSYRPVVTFTYFIDYAIYELKPWGYHLTNVLLHTINGVLLYIVLTMLFKTPKPWVRGSESPGVMHESGNKKPLIASFIFISHPALTEAVNAISFREDLLVFLFYMATLIIYLLIKSKSMTSFFYNKRYRIGLLYAISCILYFLALLSKEMALSLPLIICCYEWSQAEKKTNLQAVFLNRYNIGYIGTTVIYIFFRFYYFRNPMVGEVPLWSFSERVLTVPWLFINYVKLILFPVSLSADYLTTPLNSFFSLTFIFYIFVCISIFNMSYLTWAKEKDRFFGILFFTISLMPVYNIVPLSNPFAERYIYLPIVGLVIVFTTLISNLITKRQIVKHRYMNLLVIGFLGLILSMNSLAVIKRNSIWKDSFKLWTDTIRKMPNSYRAHNNLGSTYSQQGRLHEAINEYIISLKIKPDQVNAHYNLGLAFFKQDKINDAIREYTTAIKIKPDFAEAHFNLGLIYHKQRKINEAIWEYRTALKLKPDYAEARNNLGIAYAGAGFLEEALQEFIIAVKLKPDYVDAHFNLGNAYRLMGLKEKAVWEFEIALRLNPSYLAAKQSLEYIKR